MPINSRAKGQRTEREVAKVLTDAGFESTRGATQSAGAITADVVGLPGHWVESKARNSHSCLRFLDQAKRDAEKAAQGDVPIVVLKENRGTWSALLDFGVYLALLRAVVAKGIDIHSLNLRNFVEQPSRAVKVKAALDVAGAKLATKKVKKAR